MVVYGISCWVALLQQIFESTDVDTRASLTETRLVSNYVSSPLCLIQNNISNSTGLDTCIGIAYASVSRHVTQP